MRSSNDDIQQFELSPSFVSIDFIKYDPEIYIKLKTKIKFAAEEANSKQELVAAQQKEQTAIVKGRAKIATVRADEEAEEQKDVIRARKSKLVAKERLEEDKYKAASTLALKQAEAAGDRLKVIAGLSPLEQAKINQATAIGVAKALAGPEGITFPRIVAGGGKNGGGALQTMELKMFYDLAKEMSK